MEQFFELNCWHLMRPDKYVEEGIKFYILYFQNLKADRIIVHSLTFPNSIHTCYPEKMENKKEELRKVKNAILRS